MNKKKDDRYKTAAAPAVKINWVVQLDCDSLSVIFQNFVSRLFFPYDYTLSMAAGRGSTSHRLLFQ